MGHPELARAYTAYAGRRGSRAAVRFSKMSFMWHCDFEKENQNQHFPSTLLVGRKGPKGGGSQKRVLCVLHVDNAG